MSRGKVTIDHDGRRFPASALAALLLLSTPLLAQQWGTRSFEDEQAEYYVLVSRMDREARQLRSRIDQVANEANAYLGRFPESERVRLVQEYERGTDFGNRNRRFQGEYEKERAAKALYDEARAAFSPAQEALPEVRANLWTKHVGWLKRVIAARQAQLALLESRDVVIRGLAGLDWDEFWEDTAEDVLHVYRETLSQYPKDVFECLMDVGSAQVGALLGTSLGPQPLVAPPPVPIVPDLVVSVGRECVVGSGLKALVNAFESAWKKQFLDRMRALGVLEGVATSWWDEIVAARLAGDGPLAQGLGSYLAEAASKAGVQAVEAHASAITARALADRELPQLRQRYQALVAAASPPTRADLTGAMLKTAQEGGERRAEGLLQAARLAVDYGQKAAELYANSQVFAEIEANEVARYRRVVACLAAPGDPADAPAILAVLDRDAAGFARFLSACAAPVPADALPGTGAGQPGELLGRLRALDVDARRAVGRALAECAEAAERLSTAAAAIADAQARIARLEAIAARTGALADPLARMRALQAEAHGAALQVVEAKQKVEAAELEACAAADRAAAATTPTARLQGLTAAATAAGLAQAHGQLAASAAARAAEAGRSAAALLAQARPAAPEQDPELASAAAAIEAAEAALARAEQAALGAATAGGDLAAARAEAQGLRGLLEPLIGGRTGEMAEVDGILSGLRGLGADLGTCPGDLRRQAVAPRAGVLDLGQRLAALAARAAPRSPVALDGLAEAEAETRASAATAEVFAEAAVAIAGRAGACQGRAEAAQTRPAAGPADGWTAGAVRNIDAPAVAAGPDVSVHIDAATAAVAACRYPEAVSHADRAAAVAPGHPWLAANHATLRDLAERQRIAVEAMNAGTEAARVQDFGLAGRHSETVQRQAPRCMDGLVSGWMETINRAAQEAQFQPRQPGPGQQKAGELLPGLIEILNRSIEAGNPKAEAREPAPPMPEARKADPCRTRATYANKWAPTPHCDCQGYEWSGVECVPGPGRRSAPAAEKPPGAGGRSAPTEVVPPTAAPSCARVQYRFVDPPPYTGTSLLCTGSTGGTWLQTGGNMHEVLSIQKGTLNRGTSCFEGSKVVTKSRTFEGRICPP